MNIFKKIKEILFSPSLYYAEIKNEKGIKKAFYYSLLLSLFSLFMFIIEIFFRKSNVELFAQTIGFPANTVIGGLILFFFLFTVISGFIFSFFLFIWLWIFGGRHIYSQTYKLYIYSYTPVYLFGWIPLIGGASFIYFLILLIIGTKQLYKFSPLKATLLYLIPLLIFLILLVMLFFFGFLMLLSFTDTPLTSGF